MEETEFLKIVNSRGEEFVLCPNYDEFGVLKIEGLQPPDIDVNITESGTSDGGTLSSTHIETRNIVITFVLFGFDEEERRKLYRIFPLKSQIEIQYRNSQYSVKTSGYVKHIDPVHYRSKELARVEIVCPDPYLHAVEPITAATQGNPPECVIESDADCEIGFKAEITIYTSQVPDLRVYTSQTPSISYLRQHYLNWVISAEDESDFYDLSDKTLNLYVNDTYIQESAYTRDYMTIADWEGIIEGQHIMQFNSTNALFSGGSKAEMEFLSISGETATDLRRTTYSTTTGVTMQIGIPNPEGFDKNTWQINVSWGLTNVEPKTEGTDYTLSFNNFSITLTKKTPGNWDSGTDIVVEFYYSASNTDVRSKTITRKVMTMQSIPGLPSAIIPHDIQTYNDEKDKLLVYMGDKPLNEYVLLSVAREDGTATQGIFKAGTSKQFTSGLTYEVIHSISGTDIREYTDSQIAEGLMLVKNLKLTNVSTGEKIAFTTNFQKGDKIKISTVPGELLAVVSESDWIPENKRSLLREVSNNGGFIKLKSGENRLRLTADSNIGLVSASFEAEKLYGGV